MNKNLVSLTPGRRTLVTIDAPDDAVFATRWSHIWLPPVMPAGERWAGFYSVPGSGLTVGKMAELVGESLLVGTSSLSISSSGTNGWKLTTLKEANRLPGVSTPSITMYTRQVPASDTYSATTEHDGLKADAPGGWVPALQAEYSQMYRIRLLVPWVIEHRDVCLVEFRAPGAERWLALVDRDRISLYTASYDSWWGAWQYRLIASRDTPSAWMRPGMHALTIGWQPYPGGAKIYAGLGDKYATATTTATGYTPAPMRVLLPADSRWYADIQPPTPSVSTLYLEPAPQAIEARIMPGTQVHLALAGSVTGTIVPYLRMLTGSGGQWVPMTPVAGAVGLWSAAPNYSQPYSTNHLGVRLDIIGRASLDHARIWVTGPPVPRPAPLAVTGGIIQRVEVTLSRDPKLERAIIEADDPGNELGILGVRGDMPLAIGLIVSGGYLPIWHGYVASAAGDRMPSHSRVGMTQTEAQWPSPYWRRWTIESVGHWRRLEESHIPSLLSLLEPDPIASYSASGMVTYRVIDWIRAALQWAGYEPGNLQDREYRVTPGPAGHLVRPYTRVADLAELLTLGYLGERLTHHPSLGWRLLENPQPSTPPKLLILTSTLSSGGSGYVWTVTSLAPVVISGQAVTVVPALAVREEMQPPLYTHVIVTGTGDMSARGWVRGSTQGLFNFRALNFWSLAENHINFPVSTDSNYVGRPKPLIIADPSAATPEAVDLLTKRYYHLYCRPRSFITVQIPLPILATGDIPRPGEKVRVEGWDYVIDQITIMITSDQIQTAILKLEKIL